MRYKITVLVESESLGPAITALTPLAVGPIVSAVSGEGRGGKGARHTREVRSTPIQDTRSGRIVLDALRTGFCQKSDVEGALADAGFSRNSASPCLSKLRDAGLIRQVDPVSGTWELVS